MGKNKKQKDVVKDDSGIQFKIDQIGTLELKIKTLEVEVKRILKHLGMDTSQEEIRKMMGTFEIKK